MILSPNINHILCYTTNNPTTLRLSPIPNSPVKSILLSSSSSIRNPIFRPKRRRFAGVIRAAAGGGGGGGGDYYSLLNVSRNATLSEIKSSYRKLARKVCVFFQKYVFLFLDYCCYYNVIYSTCIILHQINRSFELLLVVRVHW